MVGRVGYEYAYNSIRMEEEIINPHKVYLLDGRKSFLFETRTKFILKRRDGVDEILDSERNDVCVPDVEGKILMKHCLAQRLKEYWMPYDDALTLTGEVFDFATKLAAEPQHTWRRVIPVVVDVDVCTVQQEGEPLVSTRERAIRARNLVPLYLTDSLKPMPRMLFPYQLKRLPRIRVEDVEQGLSLMETCPICSQKPTIATQITPLPCGHAFHSRCVLIYLQTDKLCPVCRSDAYANSPSLPLPA